jgi:drug/metabolite transporter (DMT)-like permease
MAVIVLGLACTAVTYMLYYRLITEVGEERAALGNYLTPIFALFYGVILLGEPLTIAAVVGLALIFPLDPTTTGAARTGPLCFFY